MTNNECVAFALSSSQALLKFYVKDFSPADYVRRPIPQSNCAAWIIGHLTLTDRRALERTHATDLPQLPDDFQTRFGQGEGAPHAADFGDTSILVPLFDAYRNRLIGRARQLSAEELNQPIGFQHPRFKTVGEMLIFMGVHTSMHSGQITTIRRSLGRPPLI